MLTQELIKTLHPGIMGGTYEDAVKYMPELTKVLEEGIICSGITDPVVDIKVHMLMPNQYPCIPNWHRDFIPRDKNLKLMEDKINPDAKLWLWLSNEPFTEFKDGRIIEPQKWVSFTQNDWHRGIASRIHIWRIFIRLVDKSLHPKVLQGKNCLRRHSQVYLDTKEFTW